MLDQAPEPGANTAPEAEAQPLPPQEASLARLLARTIPIALAVVALVVGGLVFANSLPPTPLAADATVAGFESGAPAPDFTLRTPDGKLVSLVDFRGKPVVINFWATWCPPCRSEMPDMQQLSDERAGDLVILAVNMQEAPDPVRGFVEKYGLKFAIVLDTSGQVSQAYRVASLPTSVFVDREGKVSSSYTGALNRSAMAKRVDRSLGLD